MYVVELEFECFDNTTISAVDKVINGLMDALRYNGTSIGTRVSRLFWVRVCFVRAVCPEKRVCT